MNDMTMKPLPLGRSTFSALRASNAIYVDKTAMVYELCRYPNKIFLSRPRRFGKSLLVSTFESLFKFGLRDFKGLAIEKLWEEKNSYKVVHLDLSNLKDFSTAEGFQKLLDQYLMDLMTRENMESPIHTQTEGLRAFINWLPIQSENSVVLLIDEYDSPLTCCLSDPSLFQSVLLQLSRLYSAIKAWEGKLRFFFITGIMKFGKASIFSELNNLTDISVSPRYGSLLGYTHDEVKKYFADYLKQAADVLGLSQDELFSELVSQYDGFCFEKNAKERVFAPWSLLNFFSDPESGFQNYWFDSAGNSTVLQQYLKDHSLREPQDYFKPKFIPFSQLSARATGLDEFNDLVLLTLAGYLTIQDVGTDSFLVSYPNKEVADALAWIYRDRLLAGRSLDQLGAFHIRRDISEGNVRGLVEQLNKLYLVMDFRKYPIKDETSWRNYTQIILMLGSGIRTYSELRNALGQSDLEIETNKLHWVIEAKFMPSKIDSPATAQRLVDEALTQIRERHYGENDLSGKKLLRLGVVFSEKERQIVHFAFESFLN